MTDEELQAEIDRLTAENHDLDAQYQALRAEANRLDEEIKRKTEELADIGILVPPCWAGGELPAPDPAVAAHRWTPRDPASTEDDLHAWLDEVEEVLNKATSQTTWEHRVVEAPGAHAAIRRLNFDMNELVERIGWTDRAKEARSRLHGLCNRMLTEVYGVEIESFPR